MSTFLQEASANWPEDEGRASAKHWNEVIRFEDQQYRSQWLEQEQKRMQLIFDDARMFDRFCDAFIQYRVMV